MKPPILTIETDPAPQDLQFLEDQINAYNIAVTGYDDFQWLAIFVRDPAQTIVAGLTGYTWSQYCKILFLWVQPDLRGTGYGTTLIQAAEAEATRRGCYTIVVDTHSFQAPTFYENQGYTVAGVYEDTPYRHQQIFLQKRLRQTDNANDYPESDSSHDLSRDVTASPIDHSST